MIAWILHLNVYLNYEHASIPPTPTPTITSHFMCTFSLIISMLAFLLLLYLLDQMLFREDGSVLAVI
jgi:hypothetical protein